MDLFERHRWAASLRVIAIRGQIERHHDIRLRHVELGEAAAAEAEEIAARIQALEQELIFAEAIKAAVEARLRRRRHRGAATRRA